MKKIITLLGIFLFLGISSFSQIQSDSIPKALGWVSDFEGIYSKAEIKSLDSLISSFEHKTRIEIAVITVDMNLTTDSSFDHYIDAVANAWGVGKKGEDNGIVIGVSSEFGRIRIVNGGGVAITLKDDETKKIIETIFIPAFKSGEYFAGTKSGILEIIKKFKH